MPNSGLISFILKSQLNQNYFRYVDLAITEQEKFCLEDSVQTY